MTETLPRARLMLGLLLLSYMMSYVDRTALGILQESIKAELALSDWQLGLLGGPAFALLYTICGLPIARLNERYHRPLIIASCLALWSAMTMACGMAQSYTQLLLARIGVGIGEAGANPASHSLIADHFPPARRAGAIAIYSVGVPIGAFLGSAITGLVVQAWGWRTAFLVLGPPGFVLALAVLLLIREVPRGGLDGPGMAHEKPASFRQVVRQLFGSPLFRHLAAGSSLVVLGGYGIAMFLPSLLIRAHHLPIGQVGAIAGLVNGAAAGVGTLLGGYLGTRLGRRDPANLARVPAFACAIATPLFLIGFRAESIWALTLLLMAGTCAIYTYIAPTFAQLHNMVDARARATAASLFYLIINLVGMGLGPLLIGAISDRAATRAFAGHGASFKAACTPASKGLEAACATASASGIVVALTAISLVFAWAGVHFWLASRAGRQ